MLLMPSLDAIIAVGVMYNLLSLRPADIVGLGVRQNAYHLIRCRQLCIDGRRKRMNQFGPVVIPQPQHGAAIRAEAPLRRTSLLVAFASVLDGGVFPAVPGFQ